MMMTGQQPLQ